MTCEGLQYGLHGSKVDTSDHTFTAIATRFNPCLQAKKNEYSAEPSFKGALRAGAACMHSLTPQKLVPYAGAARPICRCGNCSHNGNR